MPDMEKVIKAYEDYVNSYKEAVIDRIHDAIDSGIHISLFMDALKLLEEQPQIVRCRDCKAWKQYDDLNLGECELFPEYNKIGDWFCNFGERAEGR